MRKDIIVVDLDGTLADIDHRVDLVRCDKPDYDAFHKLCTKDTPKKWCVDLIFTFLRDDFIVKIVSARSRIVEVETLLWIGNIFSPNFPWTKHLELVMVRNKDDHSPDQELKRKWLHESGLKDRILFAVDDRQKVVDMWRAEGLTCLQCAKWFEHDQKCIVKECSNRRDQGVFVGDLCAPCYEFVHDRRPNWSQAYQNAKLTVGVKRKACETCKGSGRVHGITVYHTPVDMCKVCGGQGYLESQ